MAAKTLCRRIVYLSPISFLFLTYHLLFPEQKDTERNSSGKNMLRGDFIKLECTFNFVAVNKNSCVPCPHGHFSFPGWIACLPWLNCVDISHDVRVRKRVGTPGHLNAVKEAYLADWFGYDVVYSRCASSMLSEDCLHGMEMVKELQGSEFVVQLIGMCSESLEVRRCMGGQI